MKPRMTPGARVLGLLAVALEEVANRTKFVWARRSFTVTSSQAAGLAVLRWNGLPGTVAFGALEGPTTDRVERILWAREPKTTLMAMVPAASGGGRILFSQLDLQRRVDPSTPDFDPAAERILPLVRPQVCPIAAPPQPVK